MDKNCHLFATGVPRRGSRHGYCDAELGMLDFGCPSTKEGIEQDLQAVRATVGFFRALTKLPDLEGPVH